MHSDAFNLYIRLSTLPVPCMYFHGSELQPIYLEFPPPTEQQTARPDQASATFPALVTRDQSFSAH